MTTLEQRESEGSQDSVVDLVDLLMDTTDDAVLGRWRASVISDRHQLYELSSSNLETIVAIRLVFVSASIPSEVRSINISFYPLDSTSWPRAPLAMARWTVHNGVATDRTTFGRLQVLIGAISSASTTRVEAAIDRLRQSVINARLAPADIEITE